MNNELALCTYRQLVTGNHAPNMDVWHSNLAMKWHVFPEETLGVAAENGMKTAELHVS